MTRTFTRFAAAVLLAVAVARPAGAQGADPPALALRPFVLVTGEQFTARRTFEAAFGRAFQPFWGGGVELVDRNVFLDVAASRFKKTGERAFLTTTDAFPLGIPLTVEITALEVSGGYRFRQVSSRIVPYAGVGYVSYAYTESSPPPYSDPSENVDARRGGFVVTGGAEIRLHRWVGIAVDGQYTRVTGILGQGGLSQAAGESDLGGTAIRARVLIGR